MVKLKQNNLVIDSKQHKLQNSINTSIILFYILNIMLGYISSQIVVPAYINLFVS